MIRLFAALAVPEDVAAALSRRQTGLEGARWRTADQLHLTLRFFGEIREDRARDLDAELSTVGGGAFDIVLQGAGAFGEGGDINAVWAGVADSAELKRLAKACETAARRAGLKPESRNFRPHVTLAYLKRPDPDKVAAWIQANNLLKSPPIRIESFGLYSSFLASDGAQYRLEAEYSL
jgi:2'-5' RNA ligase